MTTQENKILAYLQANPEGAHPSRIVGDTGILQYNSRILGLRNRFGCNHAKDGICFASEHIINKKLKNGTTIFVYEKTKKPWDYPSEKLNFTDVNKVQEGLF